MEKVIENRDRESESVKEKERKRIRGRKGDSLKKGQWIA